MYRQKIEQKTSTVRINFIKIKVFRQEYRT